MTPKLCTKCGETKTTADFYRHKSRADGLACWCKACDSASHAARYAADPTKKKASSAAWRNANVERHLSYARQWAENNPERAKRKTDEWRAANPERVRVRDAALREAHPDRYRANRQRYRDRNPERDKANRRSADLTRRARKAGVAGERFDPTDVLRRDNWHCHLCGISTPERLRGSHDSRAPELDHIIPLAAGGEHSMRNTACACRKCNAAKSRKPLGQMRLFG